MTVTAGTMLSCANAECGARLQVQEPCPHGEQYTCACGHVLAPTDDRTPLPPTPGA